MAVVDVHRFAELITCHAWSPDHFRPVESLHVLEKHDQIVSGIDWSSKSNKIVTVSHDRNSYVWSLEGSEWVPTLVILRLNRAALCVQWSPKENKFAVGTGAKTVCICYYEQENNWWVSKLIRKRHESSVASVTWHPNNQILQLDLSYSWVFGVKWSPSGKVSHSSMIYFVDDVGPTPLAQSVAFRDLPLRDVLFIFEKMVIGVGYDSNPMVFAADDTGICIWEILRPINSMAATANDASESSKSRGGVHDNCINSIVPLSKAGSPKQCDSALQDWMDGKIAIWDLENMQEKLGHQF
ncbi:hypothetical protein EUTSA_v10017010mg [Eutrema salsugineum]|uniref:Arp2/3 complex 41 kDa subunit n=1 Tax=Eutrema salsugineum TaxID=72664 RepID=V4LM13_EUTSA|nr:hypothetical protein EUTSA_v10017010mg [Eutrema salsugineum]